MAIIKKGTVAIETDNRQPHENQTHPFLRVFDHQHLDGRSPAFNRPLRPSGMGKCIYFGSGPDYSKYLHDPVSEKHAVLFNEGNKFMVKASSKGIRFLLMSGKPLNEPIAWGGPIVMNTKEELNQAFVDLEEGTFIK